MSAEEFKEDKDMTTSVPRLLHFLWINQPIPDKYLDAIAEFEEKNPDYQVKQVSLLFSRNSVAFTFRFSYGLTMLPSPKLNADYPGQ